MTCRATGRRVEGLLLSCGSLGRCLRLGGHGCVLWQGDWLDGLQY